MPDDRSAEEILNSLEGIARWRMHKWAQDYAWKTLTQHLDDKQRWDIANLYAHNFYTGAIFLQTNSRTEYIIPKGKPEWGWKVDELAMRKSLLQALKDAAAEIEKDIADV